jgi:hypothetical protein
MAGAGQGQTDSFAAFIAERDVECPGCGYNLRGLLGRECPECGGRIGWGAFRASGPRSDPRMFRAAQGGVVVAALLGLGLLVFRGWGAAVSGEPAAIAGAIVLPLVSLAGLVAWLRGWRAVARWPRHVQGRIATAAWALALLLMLATTGIG